MDTKQLYEKTSNGNKEFSPSVDIESIHSKLSDTSLDALLSIFNHIKCEWKGTTIDTRKSVPLFLRKSGLFITYNNGTKYITEFFIGNNINDENAWIENSNWADVPDKDYIAAGIVPGVGSIGYEQLNNNLKELFNTKVNVTNFPDEEDICSTDNLLKFKDREVDASNFQSKGYVILRKNLTKVNGKVKNVLTQSMINEDNTIYEIRYDFEAIDNIKFKPNSIVFFNGGSFNSDRVNCNHYYGVVNNRFVITGVNTKGDTKSRPVLSADDEGYEYYDTTLKKKILWNGTAWVNVDGTQLV